MGRSTRNKFTRGMTALILAGLMGVSSSAVASTSGREVVSPRMSQPTSDRHHAVTPANDRHTGSTEQSFSPMSGSWIEWLQSWIDSHRT